MTVTPLLFTPLELPSLKLANRILVSPMCMYSATDGLPDSFHRQHLGTLSHSGAGLLIVESTAISPEARISPRCLGLWNDAQEHAFADLIADMRNLSEIRFGIQLSHSGRKGSRLVSMPSGSRALAPDEGGWQGVGPSTIAYSRSYRQPLKLDAAGMTEIRDQFAAAARRAANAGFDSVELHGGHGYLLHSFRAPNSNRRSDVYGGSFKNRHRFPLEVVRAVRDALPVKIALGYRLNGEDWHDDGVTLDETVAFAQMLKIEGVDYVTTSGGAGSPDIRPPPIAPGYMTGFSEAVKRGSDIAAVAVGMILSGAQAEAILQSGQADAVAVGRGMLDDPRWAHHAAAELGVDIPGLPQYSKAHYRNWPGYRQSHSS